MTWALSSLRRRGLHRLLAVVLVTGATAASAVEVRFERVAENLYAHIGDLGGRSMANEGLNANIGLVVTAEGAVLIDSGATFNSARDIHAAVRRVTTQPVRWVINTGGQDHRWLGNGYFAAQGAELMAHTTAVPDMRARGGDQLAALRALLGAAADGTMPTLPTRLLTADYTRIELGGTVFELHHRGGGHTPGDLMVWLPQAQVAFAGDTVYVDRLLAVLPVSSTRAWLEAFAMLESIAPRQVVPGHGRVTDLATARRHTRDYLQALRTHMRAAVDQGTDISAAVKRFDLAPFAHLVNAQELHPGNASRTYLELERE
jgi:glyoxylase-like metal-dependent hydrolase (beta-lactamase superfamily II)